jgi:hypothetical protein
MARKVILAQAASRNSEKYYSKQALRTVKESLELPAHPPCGIEIPCGGGGQI